MTDEEKKALAELERKRDEPEPPANGGGRQEHVNITIDLSDEHAVDRAIKHGYLTAAEAEELAEKEEEESEDEDGKPAPKRRLDRRYS